MLKFGGAIVFVGIAGVVLFNAEKGLVAAMVSVEALAFYTVAFMLANMMILLSNTMIQSLIPAFSQLSGKVSHLEALFGRIVKGSVLVLIPLTAFLLFGARDLIGLWAGPTFSENSTIPFYILMAGLLISVPGYVPYSLLMGIGKANLIARLYWVEILPYLIVTYVCTAHFGIAGAASAWSLHVAFDGIVFFVFAKKSSGANLRIMNHRFLWLAIAVLGYVPLVALVVLSDGFISVLTVICFVFSSIFYSIIAWKFLLSPEERNWLVIVNNPFQFGARFL